MWRINRPDLGFVGEGYLFDLLARRCADWRRANGVPIGLGFEQELINNLCAIYPKHCETEDPRAPLDPGGFRLRLGDVVAGTKVWAQQMLSGRKIVDAAEANARAQTCFNCKMKVPFPAGCGGHCGELVEFVKQMTGSSGVKLQLEDQLREQACYICHCFLVASAWVPIDVQLSVLTPDQRIKFEQVKGHCWKAKAIYGD